MSEKGFNRFCKTTISLFLLALVFILAPASGWASDNRVQQRQAILVICDYLEMDDLSKPELIHLHNFFGEGSVALLNTNTAGGRNRQNAAATISSGRVALGSSSEYGSEPLIFGQSFEHICGNPWICDHTCPNYRNLSNPIIVDKT